MPLGLCPCGSGLPRAACDQRPFAICHRAECRRSGCPCGGGCGQPFHMESNASKLCPACRPVHNRAKARAYKAVYRTVGPKTRRPRQPRGQLQIELDPAPANRVTSSGRGAAGPTHDNGGYVK